MILLKTISPVVVIFFSRYSNCFCGVSVGGLMTSYAIKSIQFLNFSAGFFELTTPDTVFLALENCLLPFSLSNTFVFIINSPRIIQFSPLILGIFTKSIRFVISVPETPSPLVYKFITPFFFTYRQETPSNLSLTTTSPLISMESFRLSILPIHTGSFTLTFVFTSLPTLEYVLSFDTINSLILSYSSSESIGESEL